MTRRNFTRGMHVIHAVPDAEPARPVAVMANGARVDLLNPKNLSRAAHVIGEQLARIIRWNGSTLLPFSVAQHSAIVALEMRKRGDALAGLYGLYHDAHEAIIGDIGFNTERALDMKYPGIVAGLRETIDAALYPALGLDWPVPPDTARVLAIVHDQVVDTEMRDLSLHHGPEREAAAARGVTPLRYSIRPMPWAKAADFFIKTRDALLTEAGLTR